MPVGLPCSILVADVWKIQTVSCNAIMKMYYRYLGITLFTVFVIESRGQIGQFVPLPDGKECPASSVEWRKLANARNCPGNAPYHCVADQHRQFGEVCVKESWVQPGFCPEYNTAAKKINVKRCQPFDGYICSTDAFQSHETYSHEICLRTPKPTTTTAVPLVTTTVAPSSSPVGPIVAVVLILAVIVVAAVLVWFFYLRRRYDFKIPLPFTERTTITICEKKRKEPSEDPECQLLMPIEVEKEIQRSNPCFVETHLYRDIISMLEKHNVLLVVGKTGIGKSATCVGVLEYYRDRLEWKTRYFPTDTIETLEEKTIVLVDITFGDIPLYSRYDSKIEKMLNRLYTLTRDCREFKVLVTSSSPLSPENSIPILKGCAEFNFDNIQYEKEDLKNLYKRYIKRNFNIEDETVEKPESKEQTSESVMSNHDEQQNNIKKEQLEVKADKDISTDLQADKGNSSQNLSDSQRSRQSETIDSDKRDKPVVDESAEKNRQKEESISTGMNNQEEKNDDMISVPGTGETEVTDTSETNPTGISTGKYPPIQEIGDANESRNDTAISTSDVSVELQLQTQITDEGNDAKKKQTEIEDEIWQKANISDFGLPAVCYLHRDFQEDVESFKTIDVMSYLDGYISSLAESNNKWEKQRYSTLVYMMLDGSVISSGSIIKHLLREIDPSLDPERLLVCATEMVYEGLLQKRGKEQDGKMRASEHVFSFSNDILLFVVIKSYVTRNIQMFIRYSYLPFIMQYLQPKEETDCLSIQPRVDAYFLVEFGKGCAKRNIKDNALQELKCLEEFKKRLHFHEVATSTSYNIDKEKMDDKKGNIFLRKMINHHPYLKEYYEYAEPEKFKSIPKDSFKPGVKGHPSCCQRRSPDDFELKWKKL